MPFVSQNIVQEIRIESSLGKADISCTLGALGCARRFPSLFHYSVCCRIVSPGGIFLRGLLARRMFSRAAPPINSDTSSALLPLGIRFVSSSTWRSHFRVCIVIIDVTQYHAYADTVCKYRIDLFGQSVYVLKFGIEITGRLEYGTPCLSAN